MLGSTLQQIQTIFYKIFHFRFHKYLPISFDSQGLCLSNLYFVFQKLISEYGKKGKAVPLQA